jgi:hypothetical protein
MRFVAMPYSHGREEGWAVSKDARRSKAIRNTSPRSPSASAGSTRRARNRWMLEAWRSKITAKAAGSHSDSSIATESGGVIGCCSPRHRHEFANPHRRAGNIPTNEETT